MHLQNREKTNCLLLSKSH